MKQFVVALICAVFTFSSAYAQDVKKKITLCQPNQTIFAEFII